jgi:uncharacterized Tic20 family protein
MSLNTVCAFFFIDPITMLVLPPIAIIIGAYIAVRWWIRSDSKNNVAIKIGLVISLIIGVVSTLWFLYDINTSRSSTAGIGYIFLPFFIFSVCAATFLISWSIVTILRAIYIRSGETSQGKRWRWPVYVALGIVLLFGFWGYKVTARRLLLKKAYVTTSESELIELHNKAVIQEDVELLVKLVENPNTSEELIRQIYYAIPDSTFQYPGSMYSIVFWELAKNNKTPLDILELLSEKRPGVRVQIALNHNTPAVVLERLAEDKKSLVRTWVCANPNVTKDILVKLKNDPDEQVRSYADTNFRRRGFINE